MSTFLQNFLTIFHKKSNRGSVVGSSPLPSSHSLGRKPLMIYTVIDVSGSMDSSCGGGNANAEADLYSRLDLVKHTLKTIIHSMSNHDQICVIKFSDKAEVVIPLTFSLIDKKDTLVDLVESLRTEGSTNIYDSLKVSFDQLSITYNENYHAEIYLLTDGESNINPPGDIVDTLKKHILTKSNAEVLMENVTLNTFGYGYHLDSFLLSRLCKVGQGGIFGFLPDSSMVGTVFINALSNSLTSSSREGQTIVGNFNINDVILPKFVVVLQSVSNNNTLNPMAQELIREFIAFMDELKVTLTDTDEDNKTKAFIEDLRSDCTSTDNNNNTGQVSKALQPEFFSKWGRHYLLSVLSAFEKRVCSNFKDKAMQNFKSDEFVIEQKRVEEVFVDLPPPKPSRTGYGNNQATATNMAGYYNASGGCFSPDSLVCGVAVSGEVVPTAVKDLVKGMSVLTGDGVLSEVECVVRLKYSGLVFTVGSVSLTPYHPVLVNNSCSYFPCEIENSASFDIDDYVYDMVLVNRGLIAFYSDSNISKYDDDIIMLAATFGHNCKLEKFQHDYFGSENILIDLKEHQDYHKGFITIDDYKYNRNDINRNVEKIIFQKYLEA